MGEYFSEKGSVQKPIIYYVSESTTKYGDESQQQLLYKLGWQYLSPDEIQKQRGNNTEVILKDIFINQIQKLNDFLTEDKALEVLKAVTQVRPDIEGNFTVWQFLKGLKSVYIESEKRERNTKLIDTENIDNNTFHVTEEFEFTNGINTIRQDIVFFINGIPVIFIEAKAPHKLEAMNEALEQVKRYHKDCPELISVEQAYVITHLIRFLYSATWNTSTKTLYNWKEEISGDFEILIKSFFDRERIVKLITDYTLFTRKDDLLQKVILRPHQVRAVEKIMKRAEEPDKKRALIWHTQGSGKTYTMIVTAKKLIENPIFENPTIILLVDRNELESQLFSNIKATGIEHVEVTESKEHLRTLLQSDKRGLIVSMIHKFEGMPANINQRKNIFVLVDEAHRTTTGKLGNYLMGALPNATYIGFTGTPIDKISKGQGTFLVFGKDDPPHGYLDKYSISESIEDGTTVPLHYSFAPNELHIDKELLEREFLDLKESEGVSDIEELNKILDKAVNLKNAIKSRNRIEKTAHFIAEHYREFVEPLGYKAFVVAVDREACAIYKDELDKHLPKEYSKVVFSPFHNDPDELRKYHLSEEEEKRIRKDFIHPEKNPKILIDTNKLLTGFDAPVLYCMYLDKPMRDHVLLQTISRVNRPYEDEKGIKKSAGLIVDFIGIFSKLEKALAFDSADIEGIVSDIEKLKEKFKKLIQKAKEEYLTQLQNKPQDKKVEFLLEYFSDELKRNEFYSFYKEISDIYNILSPDAFLRNYLEDMDTLTRIYRIVKEAYDSSLSIDREFTKKVENLVKNRVTQSEIQYGLDIYEINENTIAEIEKKNTSDIEKVFNLVKSVLNLVEKEKSSSPYLISIGERAENIIALYKERQKTTQEALEEIKKLIEEINRAKKEKAEKSFDTNTFTIYWILKEEKIEKAEALARDINECMEILPHWKVSEEQKRNLKKKVLSLLLKSGISDENVLKITNKIISFLSLEGAKNG
jgi:type I restriction enzyme R subunit